MGSNANLQPSAHKSSTPNAAASLQGGHLTDDTTEKGPKPRTSNVSEEPSDADVLLVDWDGPIDPMNPKK